MSEQQTLTTLDTFTAAYVECALWSSTLEPFGECASCGKDKPLCQFAKDDPDCSVGDGSEWTLCADCGGDSAGNSYEPPADENYSQLDLAPETLARMIADCERFQQQNVELIVDENLTHGPIASREHEGLYSATERAGHDFWLTRNGHGAGFWDGDWNEPAASVLTESSKRFGEVNLYVGDDGQIYLS